MVMEEHQITIVADIAHNIIRQLHITGVLLQLITLPMRLPDQIMVQALRLFHRGYVLPAIIGCLILEAGVCQMAEHIRRPRRVHHIRRIIPVRPGIIHVHQDTIGMVQIVPVQLVLPVIPKVIAVTITTGMVQVVFSIMARPIVQTPLVVVIPDFTGTGPVASQTVPIADPVITGMVRVVRQVPVHRQLMEPDPLLLHPVVVQLGIIG